MGIGILSIKNFKSIKELELKCRKVNIFIGEPNTGKSNILEALGLLSHVSYGPLAKFVRYESMLDLFYDRNLDSPITIGFDDDSLKLDFKDGYFRGNFASPKVAGEYPLFSYGYGGGSGPSRGRIAEPMKVLETFKFYRFEKAAAFPQGLSDFLSPPDGQNLLHIILTRNDIRKAVSALYKQFGYRVVLNPPEGKIAVQKELEDIVISIPYALSSETLQRIVFYLAAVYSNNDSILCFEEPEAHAFPYYTKYLAERIASDSRNNQYFIATHNPYFLISIIEKTPETDIATFVTYLEDYQTKSRELSKNEIQEALGMGSDIFFNMEQFIPRSRHTGKGN